MRNALGLQISNQRLEWLELLLRKMNSLVDHFLKTVPATLNFRYVVHDELRFKVRMLAIYEAQLAISLLGLSGRALVLEADVVNLLVAFAAAFGRSFLPVGSLSVNRGAVVDHVLYISIIISQ